ncbi:MAG: hypothetical protein PHE36_04405 [Novosphingobium sp.]|nr:hypothetical protein [Novosphingobium sp.]
MGEIKVTQEDREAAAAVAVLVEMRELILAGKADHHAIPWAMHREQAERRIVEWLRSGDAFAMTDEEIADQIEQGAHRHDD